MHVLASSLSRNMCGLVENESGRFQLPKSLQEELCLHSPILKVHSTKTSGPLRFLEIGKQFTSKNSLQLIREACSKIMAVHRVQSLQEKMEDLDSLSLNYWLMLAHKIRSKMSSLMIVR